MAMACQGTRHSRELVGELSTGGVDRAEEWIAVDRDGRARPWIAARSRWVREWITPMEKGVNRAEEVKGVDRAEEWIADLPFAASGRTVRQQKLWTSTLRSYRVVIDLIRRASFWVFKRRTPNPPFTFLCVTAFQAISGGFLELMSFPLHRQCFLDLSIFLMMVLGFRRGCPAPQTSCLRLGA